MSNRLKTSGRRQAPVTERQKHIEELRASLNAPDPEEIHPFTRYKMITYLCVVLFPLVPYAFYRIWCGKTEFSPREQKVWTALIAAVALYMVSFSLM